MKHTIIYLTLSVFYLSLFVGGAFSQAVDSPVNKTRPFEIGGHFTIMFQQDYEVSDVVFKEIGFNERVTINNRYESGFGGRVTYNINNNLAVEGEVNFTPSTRTVNELGRAGIVGTGVFSGGEKTQFLSGVKYGIRRKKYGVFGKIRPGAIRFNAFPVIVAKFVVPSLTGGQPINALLLQREQPAIFFNVDVGGVFEYYPSKRTVFRVDAGDTIIRYGAQKPKEINPKFTRHNLQINVGFGFRF